MTYNSQKNTKYRQPTEQNVELQIAYLCVFSQAIYFLKMNWKVIFCVMVENIDLDYREIFVVK